MIIWYKLESCHHDFKNVFSENEHCDAKTVSSYRNHSVCQNKQNLLFWPYCAAKKKKNAKSCSCFLTDQFEKVKKYYQESVKAEEKCNSTVFGPLSPVEQSKETRGLTEDLLDASKDKFLRALAAQNKSLNELQQKAHNLDKKVHHLSHKVDSFHSCIQVWLFT